jgi:hypothetical protein
MHLLLVVLKMRRITMNSVPHLSNNDLRIPENLQFLDTQIYGFL